MAYSFLISAIIYPIYGHWVWGGGWLSTLPFGAGAVDFAGSGVVHAVGGVAALVGAVMVGPRKGKFEPDGKPNSIPGHNMGYVVIGTMILLFGWFGFNPGSTLAATDLRISVIAVNTFLAGVAGAVVAYYISLVRTGKADIAVTCSGLIAGLVAITAPCAFVDSWAAVVIGAVAGWLVIWAAGVLEKRFNVDDPVWAIACHACRRPVGAAVGGHLRQRRLRGRGRAHLRGRGPDCVPAHQHGRGGGLDGTYLGAHLRLHPLNHRAEGVGRRRGPGPGCDRVHPDGLCRGERLSYAFL